MRVHHSDTLAQQHEAQEAEVSEDVWTRGAVVHGHAGGVVHRASGSIDLRLSIWGLRLEAWDLRLGAWDPRG